MARVRNCAFILLCFAPFVAAFGCEAAREGANPQLPLWQHRPGMAISLVSQTPLTFEGRNFDEAYERGRVTIDAKNLRIFVGSSDHGLYAIRANTGAFLWRFETMAPVQSEPLYDSGEDAVYFGSDDGSMYKVSAKDGTLRWRFMTGSQIHRQPVLHRGALYFANAADVVTALDAVSGKMLWNQRRSPIGGMSISGYAGVTVWENRVFFAFSDGHVASYDASTGAALWQPVDLTESMDQADVDDVPKYFDADTTPVVNQLSTGPVVYVAGYETGVFALDAVTGAQVWRNDRVTGAFELMLWKQRAQTRNGDAAQDWHNVLIVSTGTSGLWGLHPEDGTELWRLALPAGGISAPSKVAGALMVTTTRHGIFLISPLNGGVIDGIELGMRFSMAPSSYGNRAFVLSDGGALLSLHVTPPLEGKEKRRGDNGAKTQLRASK